MSYFSKEEQRIFEEQVDDVFEKTVSKKIPRRLIKNNIKESKVIKIRKESNSVVKIEDNFINLEDLIIEKGKDGFDLFNEQITHFLNTIHGLDSELEVSVKVDSKLNVFFGQDWEGQFFITTSSDFNNNPVLNYSVEDCLKNYNNEKGKKLSNIFSELYRAYDDSGYTYQGKILYSDHNDKKEIEKDNQKYISFTPNVITYEIPVDENSELYKRVEGSKIGIVLTKRIQLDYEDGLAEVKDLDKDFGSIIESGKSNHVFVESSYYDVIKTNINDNVEQMVLSELKQCENIVKNISDDFNKKYKSNNVLNHLKKFITFQLRSDDGGIIKDAIDGKDFDKETFIESFKKYIGVFYDKESNKKVSDKGKEKTNSIKSQIIEFIEQNEDDFSQLVYIFFKMNKIKKGILEMMNTVENKIGKAFIYKEDGEYELKNGEGFVFYVGNNVVKLIDRLSFFKNSLPKESIWLKKGKTLKEDSSFNDLKKKFGDKLNPTLGWICEKCDSMIEPIGEMVCHSCGHDNSEWAMESLKREIDMGYTPPNSQLKEGKDIAMMKISKLPMMTKSLSDILVNDYGVDMSYSGLDDDETIIISLDDKDIIHVTYYDGEEIITLSKKDRHYKSFLSAYYQTIKGQKTGAYIGADEIEEEELEGDSEEELDVDEISLDEVEEEIEEQTEEKLEEETAEELEEIEDEDVEEDDEEEPVETKRKIESLVIENGMLKKNLNEDLENSFLTNTGYVEVFKNPTYSELKDCDPNIRGVVTYDGDVYIFSSMFYIHPEIVEYLMVKDVLPFNVDATRYPKDMMDMVIPIQRLKKTNEFYVGESIKEELMEEKYDEIVKTFSNVNTNSIKLHPISIIKYWNTMREDFVNYVKSPSVIGNDNDNEEEPIPIFINPSKKELIDSQNSKFPNQYRGILTETGDIYLWNVELMHFIALNILDEELGTNYKKEYKSKNLNKMFAFKIYDDTVTPYYIGKRFTGAEKKKIRDWWNNNNNWRYKNKYSVHFYDDPNPKTVKADEEMELKIKNIRNESKKPALKIKIPKTVDYLDVDDRVDDDIEDLTYWPKGNKKRDKSKPWTKPDKKQNKIVGTVGGGLGYTSTGASAGGLTGAPTGAVSASLKIRNGELVEEDFDKEFDSFTEMSAKGYINLHLTHLEDLIVEQGKHGFDLFEEQVSNLLTKLNGMDSDITVTTKIDGAPAIFFGDDWNGNFFVATKSAFNKFPKLNYSVEDCYENHSGELSDILANTFIELKKAYDNSGYVYQGDLLFSNEKQKKRIKREDGEYLIFTPNTITYAIPVDKKSDLYNRVNNASVGIVVHNKVEVKMNEDGTITTKEVDKKFQELIESGIKNNVFIETSSYETIKFEINDNIIEDIDSKLDQIKSIVNNISNNFDNEYVNSQSLDILKTYLNSQVRMENGGIFGAVSRGEEFNSDKFIKGFSNYIKDKFQKIIDKRKTDVSKQKYKDARDKVVNFIQSNKNDFGQMIECFYKMYQVKNMILEILAQLDQKLGKSFIFTTEGDFELRTGEGYVLYVGDNHVKIVDRLGFSKLNFMRGKFKKEDIMNDETYLETEIVNGTEVLTFVNKEVKESNDWIKQFNQELFKKLNNSI